MKVLISVLLLVSLSGCAQVKQYLGVADQALRETSDTNRVVDVKKICELQYAYQLRANYTNTAQRCAYDIQCPPALYGACTQSGTIPSELGVISPAAQ